MPSSVEAQRIESRWGRAARALALACVVAVSAVGAGAHAEADPRRDRLYLAELAMLVEGSRRLLLWAETYASEPDFARFAHPLAERYVERAGRLTPPAGLVVVHPHLLLIAENVERALDAAGANDTDSFRQRARIVREELTTLENVLKQLKLKLPELSR